MNQEVFMNLIIPMLGLIGSVILIILLLIFWKRMVNGKNDSET